MGFGEKNQREWMTHVLMPRAFHSIADIFQVSDMTKALRLKELKLITWPSTQEIRFYSVPVQDGEREL